jgi:NADPH:quinone reductase-like Zn-dependent oxidoreductase
MRQVWIPKSGPPEVLELREARDPLPGPRELRVRVEAIGVNFTDVLARMGLDPDLPKLPVVPGLELAGRIDSVGNEVGTDWLGRDVIALTRFGGYSDVLCLPEHQILARPSGMSAREGAGLLVNYLTAYQLVEVMGGLAAGQTVLVHNAGGGVGLAAVQLAIRSGARVIGTASQHKHEFLKSIGVEACIDYTTEAFAPRVLEITEGRGADLVLDPLGGWKLRQSYGTLAASGRLGIYGASSAAPGKERSRLRQLWSRLGTPRFRPARLARENRGVFGVNLGGLWNEFDRLSGWLDELLAYYARGQIRPLVDRVFPLDQAAQAHHFLQDRQNLGKVLLEP